MYDSRTCRCLNHNLWLTQIAPFDLEPVILYYTYTVPPFTKNKER